MRELKRQPGKFSVFHDIFPLLLLKFNSLWVLRYCLIIFNKLRLQDKLVTPALSELVRFNARDISNSVAALKTLEGL